MRSYTLFLLFLCCAELHAQSFTKITNSPLSTTPGDSRSVNWVDVNNDGFIDCMITNGPQGGQNNFLYINAGNGSFNLLSGDTIVQDNTPSDGATWADTDNDGDLDCFVANWYNVNNLFYTNDGAGSFTQVPGGNLVSDAGYSETASWGDYDNDGRVDLYVCNSAGQKLNFLYKNLGANTFSRITTGSPVTDSYFSRCVNWTDMDLDGDLDLFVTNKNLQPENIYRNDGQGSFTKLTSGPLVNNGGDTMSASWGDYDNDGDLDVFLANDQASNALFRNEGAFTFTKILTDTVSKQYGRSFSSAWSDVDNDGDLDLFVTNAFGPPVKLVNFFYLNNGNGSFSRMANHTLVNDSAWSYGCAFGDYDNDGFEDLAVATCRFGGMDRNDLLYHNDGNANTWLTMSLIGTQSNHAAIGAKIKAKATINGNAVWQMREISAQSGYCSQNDLRVHFGLGNATKVDSLKIAWPSGTLDVFTDVNVNQFLTLTESLNTTALQENGKNAAGLELFPNPSEGKITLKMEEAFKAGDKILIKDGSGKQLAEIAVPGRSRQFSLDLRKYNLSGGTYFITVLTDKGRSTRAVLIHH